MFRFSFASSTRYIYFFLLTLIFTVIFLFLFISQLSLSPFMSIFLYLFPFPLVYIFIFFFTFPSLFSSISLSFSSFHFPSFPSVYPFLQRYYLSLLPFLSLLIILSHPSYIPFISLTSFLPSTSSSFPRLHSPFSSCSPPLFLPHRFLPRVPQQFFSLLRLVTLYYFVF